MTARRLPIRWSQLFSRTWPSWATIMAQPTVSMAARRAMQSHVIRATITSL